MTEANPDMLTSRHRRWRINIFSLTWFTYAAYYVCRKPFSQAKVPLGDLMGIDKLELAHLGTAFLLAYMVGQLLTAALAKRFSCRKIIIAGMFATLAANAGMGYVMQWGEESYTPFMVLMAINGIAQGTGWGACVGIMAHWFRRSERGTVMAFWATCYMLGSVLAKLFASSLLGLDTALHATVEPDGSVDFVFLATADGLAWTFYGAAILVTTIWTLILLFLRERPESCGISAIVDEEYATEDEQGNVTLGWSRDVIRTILVMGSAYFCFKFVRYALDMWTPMLIEQSFGEGTDVAGSLSAVFDVGGFVGVIFAGYVSDRFFKSSRTMVTFFMTVGMLLAVTFLSQIGVSSTTLFVTGLALVGFMLAGPDSLLSGVGSIDVASKRGAVVAAAIINGIGSLGSVAQEQLVGRTMEGVSDQEAITGVLRLLLIVSVLGVCVTAMLVWRKKRGLSAL
jgi:OPA family sugar phosphate sensor protein UhpC-like MFS transporter